MQDAGCAKVIDSALSTSRNALSSVMPSEPGQPRRPRAPRRFFFEFEVTTMAIELGRDSSNRAIGSTDNPIVQFVVDSVGIVDTGTVRVVVSRGRELNRDSVIIVVRDWRFRPAEIAGCPVAQLLQVPLP